LKYFWKGFSRDARWVDADLELMARFSNDLSVYIFVIVTISFDNISTTRKQREQPNKKKYG